MATGTGTLTHRIKVTEKSLEFAPKEEGEGFICYTIKLDKTVNLSNLLEFYFEDDCVLSCRIGELYDVKPNFVMEDDRNDWSLSISDCSEPTKEGNINIVALEAQYNDVEGSSVEDSQEESQEESNESIEDGPKGEP